MAGEKIDRDTAFQLIDALQKGKRNQVKVLLAANKEAAVAELEISRLKKDGILDSISALELLTDFETDTLSPYHLAALLGYDEMLEVFLLREIPVDCQLSSGVTALHLASLGGHISTVLLLCDKYEAYINKADTYGWSALHYACAAGHLEVVKKLLVRHCDVTLRDQDGTTAAFRAEICGRFSIVNLICQNHSRRELLDIKEPSDFQRTVPASPTKQTIVKALSVPCGSETRDNSQQAFEIPFTAYSTIRRVIRSTLDDSLGPGYLNPQTIDNQKHMEDPLWGIGIKTLRKILVEEFQKFKLEAVLNNIPSNDKDSKDPDYVNIDDLDLDPTRPLCAPGGPPDPSESKYKPPLPPRNNVKTNISLPRPHSNPPNTQSVELGSNNQVVLFKYIFKRIAPVLAPDWKRLAGRLGFGSKLGEIERMYPGDKEKQALVILEAWRQRSGSSVDIDHLTLALRSVGLFHVVETLEQVSQEITV